MQMKFLLFLAVSLCLATALAAQPMAPIGSGVINNIADSKVKGIKVISSSFDPLQQRVKMQVINESTLRITAFRGTLTETHADGTTVQSEFGRDFMVMSDAYYQVESRKRPWLKELPHHSLYPGETYIQEFFVKKFPNNPITQVSALFEVAAYSDNTAEVVNEKVFQTIVEWRLNNANWAKQTAKAGQDALASQADHPLLQLIETLTAQDEDFNRIELTELRKLQSDTAQTEQAKITQYASDYELKGKLLEESAKLKVVSQ